MAADTFSAEDAFHLLRNKKVLMFGDSNMRAIYKDLTCLIEKGTLISKTALKTKNEESHANDIRISKGHLTSSRNYKEVREYHNGNIFIRYEFITRLYQADFIDTIKSLQQTPDVIIINSCLWDLSRWGPNGIDDFKANVLNTMQFLHYNLTSNTRVIWTTTLPPSFKCRGGFLSKELDFIRMTLPFNIVEANKYMADCAMNFGFDVVDLHYHLRFLLDLRSCDGIHWEPPAVRYITNFLLTHLALCWDKRLPGNESIDAAFLKRSVRNSCDVLSDKLEQLNKVADRLEKIKPIKSAPAAVKNGGACTRHRVYFVKRAKNKFLSDGYDYTKDYF